MTWEIKIKESDACNEGTRNSSGYCYGTGSRVRRGPLVDTADEPFRLQENGVSNSRTGLKTFKGH